MTSSSSPTPLAPNKSSSAPSSPPIAISSHVQQSPLHHHQPPLRARLHALLQHADSHNASSPALSPSSDDTPSQYYTTVDPLSSATSLESDADASSSSNPIRSPIKRKPRKGALSVVSKPNLASTSYSSPSLASSPPPNLAALPRSLTTSNLKQAGNRTPRSDSRSSRPSRASSLDPSHLSADANLHSTPAERHHKYGSTDKQTQQRPSIKVRIITWNMHDSVPKGDLQVLLGKAGPYVAPDPDWDISYDSAEDNDDLDAQHKQRRGAHAVGQEHVPRADRIPPLPHDDAHPYHLLVIAGQECPWGDGRRLAAGVGIANELGDLGKQKKRKEKDIQRHKAKQSKTKEKQKSADSDGLPSTADGSKNAIPTADEKHSSSGLPAPSDDQSFPFMSTSSSSALPGYPLASPMFGGSSMPGLSTASEPNNDDKLVHWPNIGGKGWSDLCEDWLVRNQTAKKDKDNKDKPFISGARLARALSQTTRKDFVLSRESLADQQHTMPTHSLSAAVTPELSRAASPVGIPVSASVPGTPNQSIFEGFNALLEPSAQPPVQASSSAASAEKRKRMVPKLNLNPVELVRRTTASGRNSPATFTDSECVASPVLMSPAAVVPQGAHQLLTPTPEHALPLEPEPMPASTSFRGMLAVPTTPSMSRMSSSHSLSKLAAVTDSTSRSVSPAATDFHVEPPTLSRSPSPCPNAPPIATNGDQISQRDTASPAPSAVAASAYEACQNGAERAFADAIPRVLGPYELVIKERMMGCYMAVYVWRGCKDRVRGASRSHVKSGLLAGRVGNKGGVGISVKLGTTRLLFVNAHLAAHEDKVALRLANVAKIKAALKVDSFLPADDPRSRLEDITEQFDHTFWFGDLNFRIDISRQHADWLMMNKKYDQALAFDQLGKVLRDGQAFKGFKEAPINFPPTYKYDVLKTLKIKRNKTLASIRNAVDIPGASGAAAGKNTSDLTSTPLGESVIPEEGSFGMDVTKEFAGGDGSLSYIATGEPDSDTLSTRDAELGCASPARGILSNAADGKVDDPDRSDEDRYSISSSSAFGSVTSSSGFTQTLQQQEARMSPGDDPAMVRERELEVQRQRQLAENTSAAQGPRFFSQGAAIKAKFKLIDMMRSAANSNLKEKIGGGEGGRKKWLNVLTASPRNATMPVSASSDSNSIVDSIGSTPSTPAVELATSGPDTYECSFEGGRRGSFLSFEGHSISGVHGEESSFRNVWSNDGQASSTDHESVSRAPAPRLAGPRRSSLQMARANALAVAKAQRDAKYPHLTGATAEQIDFLEAQPYDTSAKQRVPSWCDRVLFRSTVPVDPEDSDEADDANNSTAGTHEPGLGSRVGSALSNALVMPLRHAAERRHHRMRAPRSTSSGLIAAVAGSSSIAFSHDQAPPAEVSLVDPMSRRADAARKEKLYTAPMLPSATAVSSPKAETRTLAGVERTRPPQLLQRFLQPGRRRQQIKALSPSLTFSDLTHQPNQDTSWAMKNGSLDMLPTWPSFGLGLGSGLGLAGLETRAISTVDLPSQVEERDNRFEGAAKWVASPVLPIGETQVQVEIPPRQSSASNSPVAARHLTGSPTLAPSCPTSLPPRKAPTCSPTRSTSAALPRTTPFDVPLGTPAMPTRSVPPPTPRRTPSLSGHGDIKGGWMDSLSSHLPAFFAPAISALRSHRHGSQGIDANQKGLLGDEEKTGGEEEEQVVIGPKKGRIECLLYKSLDDREMRILEGRSDHRPVIFVGAIGI